MQKPNNLDLELIVLGGMLNDEKSLYDALEVVTEDFFDNEDMKQVFNKITEHNNFVSAHVLMKKEKDTRIKRAIDTADGSWTNPKDFGEALKGLKQIYLKRQLYHTIQKTEKLFDEHDYDELVSLIDTEINQYGLEDEGDNIILAEERAPEALMEYQERRADPKGARGISFSVTNQNGITTGLPSLDKTLYGAKGGDLIMVAAKTGEGKTAFAINLMRLFSFSQDYKGYYQNTEMDKVEMESRLLAPVAKVTAGEILTGELHGSAQEIRQKDDRISDAYDKYMKRPVILSKMPSLHIQKSKALAKKVKAKYGLDYLVVDYIGRLDAHGFSGDEWQRLYYITKELKGLAMVLDIPIIMLAQRNQAGDVEGAKKMMNECDAVLYLEPTTKEDADDIQQYVVTDDVSKVNYKIIKKKVRRNSNAAPIFVKFNKDMNFFSELKST